MLHLQDLWRRMGWNYAFSIEWDPVDHSVLQAQDKKMVFVLVITHAAHRGCGFSIQGNIQILTRHYPAQSIVAGSSWAMS